MRTIAIIGAGFSGSMVAAHLLRLHPASETASTAASGSASAPNQADSIGRILLIERNGKQSHSGGGGGGGWGSGGVAYGTNSGSHALNVPAGRMSAFDDEPDHFLKYLRLRDPSITGGNFVPRKTYGEYLARTLDDARRASRIPLIRVAGEAEDLRESASGVTIHLHDGRELMVDRALLAIGNYPPADPPVADPSFYSSIRYARDPWAPDALEMDHREPVLLLGTGLTMLDIALALRDSDHQGVIYAISRRGLLPQGHRVSAKAPPHLDRPATIDRWPNTALGMLKELRREVREAAAKGIDWREVVTSIRHDTPALWQRLDLEERRKFLRHVRPFWETHRHRASPNTTLGIETMIEAGKLKVITGRLVGYEESADRVIVRLRVRAQSKVETITVGKVINCTGPDTDLARVRDPLMASMRKAGLIRPDALGLGLDTDPDGRLIGANGKVGGRLYLVGPLRKGQLWENTAVPELRGEAARMARRLACGVDGADRVQTGHAGVAAKH